MRPLTLNRDSSAMSNTLPQRGHLGRLSLSVAAGLDARTWHADWTIIVEPPRRSRTAPDRPQWCAASMASPRRLRETLVAVDECAAAAQNRAGARCDLSGWRRDRRAIGPAGQQAIFHPAVGVEFARQYQAEREKPGHHRKRDQRLALVALSVIAICHRRPILRFDLVALTRGRTKGVAGSSGSVSQHYTKTPRFQSVAAIDGIVIRVTDAGHCAMNDAIGLGSMPRRD